MKGNFQKILHASGQLLCFMFTGLGGFASHLNRFLQDTKKFDGRLCTMTVVVQSESLFQEFSDLPKANSWWQSCKCCIPPSFCGCKSRTFSNEVWVLFRQIYLDLYWPSIMNYSKLQYSAYSLAYFVTCYLSALKIH